MASIAPSHDGRWLAVGGWDGRARLWDLASGIQVHVPDHKAGNSAYIGSVQFDASGQRLATTLGTQVRFWDSSSGLPAGAFSAPAAGINLAARSAVSGDARWLAYHPGSPVVTLTDLQARTERRIDTRLARNAGSLLFSPDGRLLATFGYDAESTKIWKVADGELLHRLRWVPDLSPNAVFSRDGSSLAILTGGEIRRWSMQSGDEAAAIEDPRLSKAFGIAYSPDGKRIAAAAADRMLAWDAASGALVLDAAAPTGFVNLISYAASGCCIFTGGREGVIKLWDARTGALLATVASVNTSAELDSDVVARRIGAGTAGGDDWVVVTPDGLFDGTPAAWDLIHWRFRGIETAPLELFFNEFYRPGLLAELLAGKRPQAPRDFAAIDRRQPQVTLEASGGGERRAKVSIRIEDTGAGARDVRLFRNGSLVRHWRGDVLQGAPSAELNADIALVAGENRLSAYAFNRDNVKSADARAALQGVEALRRRGTAYVLAIGVDRHANPAFDLRYAGSDARTFAGELERAQAALGSFERIERIHLLDGQATKANILAALKRLAGSAQPEDAVVVFFAGHGFADEPRFYLVPHDVAVSGSPAKMDDAALKALYGSGISDQELEEALAGMDSGQVVLVIDACNSGQALEAEEKRRGPMNSRGLAQLAYEKGMNVLTAAQGRQAALEFEKLGHGLLTYVLVEEGLKTAAADRQPKDGAVVTREWLDYAALRVPRMQLELMQESAKRGRSIAVVDGEEAIADVTARLLQRPRVFYRREPERNPMVVVRP